MSLSTSTPGDQPDEERPGHGARSGFVGAFARTVRRGASTSPLGKVAVSGLVVVLAAGAIVGLGLLLNKPAKPTATPAAATASASRPVTPASSRPGRRSDGKQTGESVRGSTVPQAAGPGTVALGQPAAGGAGTAAGGGAAPRAGSTVTVSGSATPSASPASGARRSAPKNIRFQATAGYGCDSPGAGYGEYGWYENGDAGWWRLAHGSYRGEGCSGEFTDMPMSGSDRDTAGQAIMWGFAPVRAPLTCELKLFVPTSSSARDVAAKRAHFVVLHGNRPSDETYSDGDRFINQGANKNRWVGLGTYPVDDGQIGVKLTNRGTTSGYSMTYPHLAGGAVKIVCWDR